MMLVWAAMILATNVALGVLSALVGTPSAIDWALRITVSGFLTILAVIDFLLTDDEEDEDDGSLRD